MKEKLQIACRRWNQWSHRYVNGTQGMVSIFLAVCMIPLLSISALLVESVRYQNAVELLQEVLDSAGLSTVACYDSYLEERFGLLAVSQDTDVTATMSEYINLNNSALGNSATVNSVSASGAYALSDVDIFEQQILEYAEVSAPVKSLTENLNIKDVLEKLQNSVLGDDTANQIRNIEKAASNTASAADSVTDLLDSIVTLKEKAEEYQTALSDYQSKYNAFQEKVQILIDTIKTAEDSGESDSEDADSESAATELYDTTEVMEALSEVNSARLSYKSAAITLKSKYSSYSSAISSTWTKLQSASNSIATVNSTDVSQKNTTNSEASESTDVSQNNTTESEDSESTEKESSATTVSSTTVDWMNEVVDSTLSVFQEMFGTDYETKAAQVNSELSTQINLLSNEWKWNGNNPVPSWLNEPLSDWLEEDLSNWMEEAGYAEIDTKFTAADTNPVAKLEALVGTLIASTSISSTTSANLSSYISLVKNLGGLSGVYDSSLNAQVSSSYNCDEELYARLATAAISDILDAGQNLISGMAGLNSLTSFVTKIKALIEITKALYEFAKGVVELLSSIIALAVGIIGQLAYLISAVASGELGKYYLLAAYSTYNMPNRTNATSGSSLSSYSYKKVAQLNGDGIPSSSIIGSLISYVFGQSPSVSKSTFYGAELEYLMGGTNSEIGNQTAVFVALYMERFIFNIGSVLSNYEVTGMATLAGAAAIVVYIVIAIAEPLVDTLLLVNGGNVYLIKDSQCLYLTPSGLSQMATDLLSCVDFTAQQKAQMNATIKKIKDNSSTKDSQFKGTLKMKYEEHAMLLLMLTVDKDTLLKRLQNIVQMESAAYYSGTGFALAQAYTAVYADVTFTLNPMLNLDTLTENGLFRFHQTGYFSY